MNAQVVSFNCILKNKAGKLISSTYNREVLTISDLNLGGMLSGLNKNMQNLKKGEIRSISLLAEEAYGFYDPKKVILYPRKKLPQDLRIGQSVNILDKYDNQHTFRVLEIHQDHASLDGNHPLAGQDLIFEIEALEARPATAEEIAVSLNTIPQQLLH